MCFLRVCSTSEQFARELLCSCMHLQIFSKMVIKLTEIIFSITFSEIYCLASSTICSPSWHSTGSRGRRLLRRREEACKGGGVFWRNSETIFSSFSSEMQSNSPVFDNRAFVIQPYGHLFAKSYQNSGTDIEVSPFFYNDLICS